jgi:hypothetical protein
MNKILSIGTRLFMIIAFLISFTTEARRSDKLYEWSAGVRLGGPYLASAKHFFNKQFAGEVMAGYHFFSPEIRWRFAGMALQFHIPIESAKNLNFYCGGGPGVFYWIWKQSYKGTPYPKTIIGGFVQAGLEYKFKKIPVAVSIDWTPMYQSKGYDNGLGISYGSIGARYIFR